jgi:hypothetical protein
MYQPLSAGEGCTRAAVIAQALPSGRAREQKRRP